MAFYEIVFIARPDLSVEEVDNLSDKLCAILSNYKGSLVSKEYWGLRTLAYKINKNDRGHYILLNIESSNDAIVELRRVMGFNEDIIRSAIFVVKEHKTSSRLKIANDGKDYKAGKLYEIVPSAIDMEIEKIIINNI